MKNTNLKILFLLLLIFLTNICSSQQINSPTKKVKNVILMIGDGMGFAQIAATRINTVGAKNKLHMERLRITTYVTTHSSNNLVTCSSAAGTALATGYKTNNGLVSINPDGKKLKTILQACKEIGMRSGLVVTSTITHATPAVFASHINDRNNEQEIAKQLIANKVNVLFGGGKKFFIPMNMEGSKRSDKLNLINQAISNGYKFIQTKEELLSVQNNYVLGLFNMDALTTIEPEPSIADLTKKAISLLNCEEGFFLMVEGSQIDWACHKNNTEEMIKQVLNFDNAVQNVLDFARKDRHTLVIVTADHECGGLVLNHDSLDQNHIKCSWTEKDHTGIPVPLFAYGPHSTYFSGVKDNTEIPKIIARLLEIKDFPKIIE